MWTVVRTRAGGDPNAPSDSCCDFAKRRHFDASEFWRPSLVPSCHLGGLDSIAFEAIFLDAHVHRMV